MARIPTIIIVNDNNKELSQLQKTFSRMVRIYERSSIQGEQLYTIREGIIYFDHEGNKQFTLQDDYSKALARLEQKLEEIDDKSRSLLNKYLIGLYGDPEEEDNSQTGEVKDPYEQFTEV